MLTYLGLGSKLMATSQNYCMGSLLSNNAAYICSNAQHQMCGVCRELSFFPTFITNVLSSMSTLGKHSVAVCRKMHSQQCLKIKIGCYFNV